MSTKKIASLCVIKNKSKFLLLKRINEPNIGKYVPVGGKLKDHETPKKAAKKVPLKKKKAAKKVD